MQLFHLKVFRKGFIHKQQTTSKYLTSHEKRFLVIDQISFISWTHENSFHSYYMNCLLDCELTAQDHWLRLNVKLH